MSDNHSERPDALLARWRLNPSKKFHPQVSKTFAYRMLGLASLALVVLTIAFFVAFLAFAPRKTPMLLLNAAPYENEAIPPLGFLAEDTARFSLFDNQSLSILNQDGRVSNKDKFFAQLEIANNRSIGWNQNNPLIIWISMHGVLLPDEEANRKQQDQANQKLACFLLPPLGSIDRQDTLIKLSEVFDSIKNLAGNRNVVVLMDCARLQRSIPLGLSCNDISDHLGHEISQYINDHTAVILACTTRENSDPRPFANGSVFAYQTCQALSNRALGGETDSNHDGWINLEEFYNALSKGVSTWSERNRSTTQTPELIRTNKEINFQIAHKILKGRLNFKTAIELEESKTNQTLADSQIDRLWSRWEELRSQHLYSYEPKDWHWTERKIQALERWSRAGKDYESLCNKIYQEVDQRIEDLRTALDSTRISNEDEAFMLPFSKKAPMPLKVDQPDFGPWCRYFGVEYKDEKHLLEKYNSLLSSTAPPDRVTQSLKDLSLAVPLKNRTKSLQFLKMWGRNLPPSDSDIPQSPMLLLRAQERLERLSIPTAFDGRLSIECAHDWIRALLVSSDRDRRTIEDFTMSFPWIEDFTMSFPWMDIPSTEEFQEQLRKLEVSCQSLFEQIKLQQRIAATLPELSDWLTNPTIHVGKAELKRSLVSQVLEPLLESIDDHERKLSEGPDRRWTPQQTADELKNIDEIHMEVLSKNYKSLEDNFRKQALELTKTPSNLVPKRIREVDYFIENPMTPGGTRRNLKLLKHSAESQDKNKDPKKDGTPTELTENSNAELIPDTNSPRINPMIVRMVNDSPRRNKWLSRLEFTMGKQSQGSESDASPKTNNNSDLITNARFQRWCYSFGFFDNTEDFVTEALQRAQLDWLLWSADRSMEDFWGPAGDSEAYFDRLTENFLSYASQVCQHNGPLFDTLEYHDRIQEIRKRFDERKVVAKSWCTMDAEPLSKTFFDKSFQTFLTAQLNKELDQWEIHPSSTLAMIGIRKSTSSAIEPIASVGRLLPLGEDIKIEFPLNQKEFDRSDQLVGAIRFRGHENYVPIPLERIPSYVTRTEFDRAREITVCVHDTSKELSVSIILDCSNSMGDLISGKDSKSSRKIDIAKKTLADLLLRLAYRGENQVGLHVVGNRMGWSRKAPVELLKRPGVKLEPGDELTPSIDIETLSSLEPMNVERAKGLIARIASVDAWGQSPLYLAIDRALQEFPAQGNHENSRVILLTDGTNYQFIDSSENVNPTTIADVLRTHQKAPVSVHVFGIGMDRVKHLREISELESLAKATGGSFETIQDQQDLGNAIQKLLHTGSFQVASLAPDLEGEKETKWVPSSRIQQINLTESNARAIQVSYTTPWLGKLGMQSTQEQYDLSERLWVEGGESVYLYADIIKKRLIAKPFSENVVAARTLVDAVGKPTKKVVRVHQPQWSEQGELSIPISWQDAWDEPKDTRLDLIDWRVSRRPAAIWITLTPLAGSSESPANRFVFYDRSFQKGLGVPVTHLRAVGWPEGVSKARIHIQSHFTEDSNSERIKDQVESLPAPVEVMDLVQRGQPLMKSFKLLSAMQEWLVVAEGVKLKASRIMSDQVENGDVLEIRLKTDSETVEVASLKTNIIGTAQEYVLAVDRQFDQQNKIAIHTFRTNRKIDDSRTNITVNNLDWEIPKLQSFTCEPIEIEIPSQKNRLPPANTAIRP